MFENFDFSPFDDFHYAMEMFCLEILHQGYEAMRMAKGYDMDWEEDDITAHYIGFMEKLSICKEWQIDIIPQFYIYSEKHTSGEIAAKKAPRIDFKFTKWNKDAKVSYFAEAKNVSEKGWKKKNGTYVSSSYYYNRYIETGITHLLSGYYPNTCFLIAYVLNGDKNAILQNLNTKITTDFATLNYGIITKPIDVPHEEYYISENIIGKKVIVLKHLFLQLA